MIQKYLRIRASKEEVLEEVLAYGKWPEWWPGVQKVHVIKDDPAITVLEMVIKTVSTISMTMEFNRLSNDIIKFKQIKGWFKSYQGDYSLLPSPDGAGVTFKITTELESGMLVPKSMVYIKLAASLGEPSGTRDWVS